MIALGIGAAPIVVLSPSLVLGMLQAPMQSLPLSANVALYAWIAGAVVCFVGCHF
jgi:hypothetical protein